MTPRQVLEAMLRSDAARPRLTYYDDAAGERLDLSAKVLTNWVNKAANALQEHFDAGVGSRVHLDLPTHWRALYWALAAWSVGAEVTTNSGAAGRDADTFSLGPDTILVTDRPAAAARFSGESVVVTLAMLARGNPDTPVGAMDEARELATFGDQFQGWHTPEPDAPALADEAADPPIRLGYASVVPQRDWPTRSRVLVTGTLPTVLLDVLGTWAVDGSVVLTAADTELGAARSAAEGITLERR